MISLKRGGKDGGGGGDREREGEKKCQNTALSLYQENESIKMERNYIY
jgi:hypothetical protein